MLLVVGWAMVVVAGFGGDVAKLQPLCISVSAYVRLCPSFNF